MTWPQTLATIGLIGIASFVSQPTYVAHAQDANTNEGGYMYTFELPGHANPPGYAAVDACAGNADYPVHVSERTQLVKNEQERVTSQLPSGTILASVEDQGPGVPGSLGFWAVTDQEFEIEFIQWEIACAADDALGLRDPDTVRRYWVRRPTPGGIVPGLLGIIAERLRAPEVIFTPEDDEFGWIYVQVATDFRVTPTAEVYEELTVTNVAGSATGWVRAAPSQITFQPGEPGGARVECTYEQAQAPYVPDRPGACSYAYQHSSAIGVGNIFVNRTTLYWQITSSAPLVIEDNQSWREDAISVAEIQAVVNAD